MKALYHSQKEYLIIVVPTGDGEDDDTFSGVSVHVSGENLIGREVKEYRTDWLKKRFQECDIAVSLHATENITCGNCGGPCLSTDSEVYTCTCCPTSGTKNMHYGLLITRIRDTKEPYEKAWEIVEQQNEFLRKKYKEWRLGNEDV